MEFISHHEIEWELAGDGVRAVIVSEFGMRDIISPRSRIVSTEDLKTYFNFLVYLFSLSIGLGMIGGEKGAIVLQGFSKFSTKEKANWGP